MSKLKTPYLDKEIEESKEWISLDPDATKEDKERLKEYQAIKAALKRLEELEEKMKSLRSLKGEIKEQKFIAFKENRYSVSVYSKKYKKNYYVGRFETLSEAIQERDSFIANNAKDICDGTMPRGITLNEATGKYVAYVDTSVGIRYYLGYHDTIKEAVKARYDLIESWK